MYLSGTHRRAQHVLIALAAVAVPCAAAAQADAEVGAAVGECRRVPSTLERLDCYDRAFPPVVDPATPVVNAGAPRVDPGAPAVDPGTAVPQPSSAPVRDSSRAQIVEVAMPSVSTTVLVAADGRVFTRQDTTVVLRWPATPFDVNIETSRLGNSTYLIHPRTGERVRVLVRD